MRIGAILKLMLKKDIVLNYEELREELHGVMTSDYVIKHVIPKNEDGRIIEEDKTQEIKVINNSNIEEDRLLKAFTEDFKAMSFDGSCQDQSRSFRMQKETPAKSVQIQTKEKKHIFKHTERWKVSKILIKKKIGGKFPSNDQNIFPVGMKASSKFIESKDYIEIAIRY